MYDGIIFDQDGVLLDSGINKFHWMDQIRIDEAEKKGLKLGKDEVKKIVKSSSHETVEEILNDIGMTWEQLRELERKKENWKIERIEKGEITLFPKVKEVLQRIEHPTALVTNAPYMSTHFTLNYFGIKNYFDHVNAPRLKNIKKFYDRKKPKPVMIHEAIEDVGLENPVMIGDSGSDIKAAENAGIDSIHIQSYGFESEAEPTYKADTVAEVTDIVEKKTKTDIV